MPYDCLISQQDTDKFDTAWPRNSRPRPQHRPLATSNQQPPEVFAAPPPFQQQRASPSHMICFKINSSTARSRVSTNCGRRNVQGPCEPIKPCISNAMFSVSRAIPKKSCEIRKLHRNLEVKQRLTNLTITAFAEGAPCVFLLILHNIQIQLLKRIN